MQIKNIFLSGSITLLVLSSSLLGEYIGTCPNGEEIGYTAKVHKGKLDFEGPNGLIFKKVAMDASSRRIICVYSQLQGIGPFDEDFIYVFTAKFPEEYMMRTCKYANGKNWGHICTGTIEQCAFSCEKRYNLAR